MLYEISSTRTLSRKELREINNVAEENSIANGGQLMVRHLIDTFASKKDIMVLAKQKGYVVGYTFLREYSGGLYVAQIAVAKGHKHKGVGSAMYSYIKKHSLGYEMLSAHARCANTTSQKFHLKNGFEKADSYSGQNLFSFKLEKINDRIPFKKERIQEIELYYNEDERFDC